MIDVTEYPVVVFGISFVVLWFSALAGWVFIKRSHTLDEEVREDFRAIQAATLTLLGLIIGFTFSAAAGRYDMRKNYEGGRGQRDRNGIRSGRVAASRCSGENAGAVERIPRSAHLFLQGLLRRGVSSDQCEDRAVAERTVVHGCGPGGGASNRCGRPGGIRHERRAEFAGIYPGGLLEPHSVCRMGPDGRRGRRLQCPGQFASRAGLASKLLPILPVVVSVAFMLIADIDSPRRGIIRVNPQNLISLAKSLGPQ